MFNNNLDNMKTIEIDLNKNTINTLQKHAQDNYRTLEEEINMVLNKEANLIKNDLTSDTYSIINQFLNNKIINKNKLDDETKTIKLNGSYYNYEIIDFKKHNYNIDKFKIITLSGNKVYLVPIYKREREEEK